MNETKHEESVRQLGTLLEGIKVAMLTTLQARDGSLHSRPMMSQLTPFDGSLYFFSKFSSAKVDEIRNGSQVNLSYVDPNRGRYISVSGAAYVIRERMRMEEMWNDIYRSWFPNGLDEPDLALLRIDVHQAEVWDAASKVNGTALKFG
jgi:general stress protein 26